jgi:hypothetical protein
MSAADPEARAQTPEIDERHARAVAEQAREGTSALPGFAKELYLGRLRLDLIHPMPVPDREDEERGEAFLARLHDFCEGIDAQRIEREERIPDEVVAGLRELTGAEVRSCCQRTGRPSCCFEVRPGQAKRRRP